MKSGGYLALVNPCSGGHIGPQSSSSDLESSVKESFGPINLEEVDSDQLSDEANEDPNGNNKKSKLKRSLTLHDRKKSKTNQKN
jgi:hypothetical protein